jgi:hypothetical protein
VSGPCPLLFKSLSLCVCKRFAWHKPPQFPRRHLRRAGP